jgi:hypothetical protein
MNATPPAQDATDQIQPWYNEGCRGRMIVSDTRQLDDPTIPGPEPVVHTTGTQAIETRDTLVTVETDLARGQTRYMIVSPAVEGFETEAGYGQQARKVSASAMPDAVVIAGPFPGGIGDGSYSAKVAGGEVRISWKFQRQ